MAVNLRIIRVLNTKLHYIVMINTFLLRCMHCKEPETNLVYFDMHKVWILRVNVWIPDRLPTLRHVGSSVRTVAVVPLYSKVLVSFIFSYIYLLLLSGFEC